MFRHLFDNAREIAAYPVFSLVVFFIFFVGVVVYVVRANKKQMDQMSRMPLDENEEEPANLKS